LALNAGLRAADPAPANNPSLENPYATVAVRNIFGLNPPPPPESPAGPQNNLPKITPTGIMSEFGYLKTLFKVAAGNKPGQPAKDQFYISSEGQRQDDIEVIKIDEKNGLVTFDNHGTMQELPLANVPDSSAAPSSSPGPRNPGMTPGRPGGRGNIGPGGFTRFGAGPGGRGSMGKGPPGLNGGNGTSANNGVDFGSSTQGRIYQPEASTLTPEEAQVFIATQHLKVIQENNPIAPLYPPTAIDSQAGISQGADAGGGPPAP